MKKMKLLVAAVVMGCSSVSMASLDYALELGIRQQNGDSVDSSAELDSRMNFQVGMSGFLPIADKWAFRTGLFYTERNVKVKNSGQSFDVKFSTIDIPLTAMYKFEDYAGVFFGLNLVSNLDSSVSNGGTLKDVESLQTPIVLGAAFKFAPQMGASVYYEIGTGDVAQGMDNFRAIGANLMVTFD